MAMIGTSPTAKVEVNGVQLYCVQYGSGSHPILFIPSAVAHADFAFSAQFKHFEREGRGYTAVGYDLRGYGGSRPPNRSLCVFPEDYKTDAYDGYQLMTSLGFSEFSVLGWCSGGTSALILAAHFPSAVKKVVVWGAKAFITEEDVKRTDRIKDVTNWSPRIRVPIEEVYGFQELSRLWREVIDSRKALLALKPDGDLCAGDLGMVKCPTLILHEEKDVLSTQSQAEYLRDHITGSRLHLFANGKHDLHMHSPAEFNEVVDEFLRE